MRIIYRVNNDNRFGRNHLNFIDNLQMILFVGWKVELYKDVYYYLEDKFHRVGGPAAIYKDSCRNNWNRYFYLNGRFIKEKEYWERVNEDYLQGEKDL